MTEQVVDAAVCLAHPQAARPRSRIPDDIIAATLPPRSAPASGGGGMT